jgi:hypothetical protein
LGLKPTQASGWFCQKPGVQPSLPGGVVVVVVVDEVVSVDGVVVGVVVSVDGVVVPVELVGVDPVASPTPASVVASSAPATRTGRLTRLVSRRIRLLFASLFSCSVVSPHRQERLADSPLRLAPAGASARAYSPLNRAV